MPHLTKREVERKKGREDLGCDIGKRNWNKKNTKICLACIRFYAHTIPNMKLYCSSMQNYLAFRPSDMGGFFLVFGTPNVGALIIAFWYILIHFSPIRFIWSMQSTLVYF